MAEYKVDGAISAKGCRHYENFRNGGKLSMKQSILAKCAECNNFYIDGKADCEFVDCPLYQFMPYGQVVKNRPKRKMSEKQKANCNKLFKKRDSIA